MPQLKGMIINVYINQITSMESVRINLILIIRFCVLIGYFLGIDT